MRNARPGSMRARGARNVVAGGNVTCITHVHHHYYACRPPDAPDAHGDRTEPFAQGATASCCPACGTLRSSDAHSSALAERSESKRAQFRPIPARSGSNPPGPVARLLSYARQALSAIWARLPTRSNRAPPHNTLDVSVVSLRRASGAVLKPSDELVLESGDTLVLSGLPEPLTIAEGKLLVGH